jgi:hypothetical protein
MLPATLVFFDVPQREQPLHDNRVPKKEAMKKRGHEKKRP